MQCHARTRRGHNGKSSFPINSVPQRKRPRSYWNIPTSDLPRASLFESESYFLLGPVGTLPLRSKPSVPRQDGPSARDPLRPKAAKRGHRGGTESESNPLCRQGRGPTRPQRGVCGLRECTTPQSASANRSPWVQELIQHYTRIYCCLRGLAVKLPPPQPSQGRTQFPPFKGGFEVDEPSSPPLK